MWQRPWLFALIFTILGLWGIDSALGIYRSSVQFYLADMDSTTTGQIVVSKCRSNKGCRYRIRYIYNVDAVAYRNEIVRYEAWNTEVRQRLAEYPVGKTVSVIYDSSFPQWSILVDSNELPVGFYWRWFFNLILIPVFFYYIGKLCS